MDQILKDIYLSVVIPAYNEERRIGPTIRRVLAYLNDPPVASEILVVVDGSRDKTIEEIHRAAGGSPNVYVLDNGVNRGKGFCVRRGVLEARGRFILFCDADLSTPIEEVARLLTSLQNGADVAIASRALAESDVRVHQPWWREKMGRVFNWFVQSLVLDGIQDSQCGFKCFPREVARRIFPRQRIERFGFDVEVLWIARKLGYQIKEVPVIWVNDPQSKVHPVRDSLWMLFDLLRIRFNNWRGTYGVTLELPVTESKWQSVVEQPRIPGEASNMKHQQSTALPERDASMAMSSRLR